MQNIEQRKGEKQTIQTSMNNITVFKVDSLLLPRIEFRGENICALLIHSLGKQMGKMLLFSIVFESCLNLLALLILMSKMLHYFVKLNEIPDGCLIMFVNVVCMCNCGPKNLSLD